ncbi:Aminoglycoside phosphotransferase [Penicillium griseofulvum]|uniref:Aminoglycoside phosphotransferase n=1 Tax=Penicillium patulum TaxID=5078 RepID=A0A135LJ81_PENPA|nr:Aminoglycoside phosphotransferase [Penicillium griseofulvum]KXG49037.1 Aminoglycoside phosphotransferase [Penicillium griseofulvum]
MAPLARYHATTRLIKSASLTSTDHAIWRAFLDEAVDPGHAACYIWKRIHDRTDCSTEQVLHELKIDWKRLATKLVKQDQVSSQACALVEARDDSHCFMLDQKPLDPNVSVRFDHAWVIPPSLFDDSDMDPQYFVSRLFPEPCGELFLSDGSHWDSTMQMFIMESQGTNQPLPDPFLLRTHYRIAASLHLFHVEERIADGWPSPPLFHLNIATQKILRSVWHLIPHFIRVQCYGALIKLGSHLYPQYSTGLVHRLPFGLYAKESTRTPNEGETLRLVERYTSIPAPLWIDDYQGIRRVLIMTAMPGDTLDMVFHRLSYPERKQLSKDLKNALSQLRSIPNQSSYHFSDCHGGPLFDYRFPSGVCGPFRLISDFNSFLVHRHVLSETREKVATVHARQYRSVFTHADIHPRNIIIDRGRLSGIVDWECAGFYPEYWEFTKLFYGVHTSPEILGLIHDAFVGDTYEEELEAERLLWYDTPFGA